MENTNIQGTNIQDTIKDKSMMDDSISYQTLKEKPNTTEHL